MTNAEGGQLNGQPQAGQAGLRPALHVRHSAFGLDTARPSTRVPAVSVFTDAVDRVFADDGALAGAVPEFESRPGQRAMARAVADAIEGGGVLLAEAGTGTGKTVAYLVPAILSGRRVLVSTGTKTLQEQIIGKDLPALRESLGIPFKATCMKGRGNYLCLHRFDQFRDNPMAMAFADVDTVATIAEWAERTEAGDRAELEQLPEDLGVWSEVSAATENCIGSECPRHGDCFITRMRQRAAESDIVVVNHHLLCADASVRQNAYGEVIPECHVAIIDEAHQLEDVATQVLRHDGQHLPGRRPGPGRRTPRGVRRLQG